MDESSYEEEDDSIDDSGRQDPELGSDSDNSDSEAATEDSNHEIDPGSISPPTEDNLFEVLGEVKSDQKVKVERVLPDWLANPTIISTDLKGDGEEDDFQGLDDSLIANLKKNNIQAFFPVQKKVIPWLLRSVSTSLYYRQSDLCVSAPTGSGKTLAYVLPVIQTLKGRVTRGIRALVVLPIKELSKQVHQVFTSYAVGTQLKVGIVGGKPFHEEQKMLFSKSVTNGAKPNYDILISTPMRLIDHICNTPGFSLKDLKFLIIDEADRMMDDTEHNWLEFVERSIYGKESRDACLCDRDNPFSSIETNIITPCVVRKLNANFQKLLFSATLSHDPYKLQKLSLFNPKLFTTVGDSENGIVTKQKGDFTGRYRTPKELTEHVVLCDDVIKPLVVWFMLTRFQFTNVLCFTDSNESTHRLCLFLQKMGDIKVGEISSHLLPDKRSAIFKRFQRKEVDILVCTDGMARGIDFEDVDYVFNYDRPKYPETYVHRVGRTARAGKLGTAITIITSKKDLKLFKYLLKKIEKDDIPQLLLPYAEIKRLTDQYNDALQEVSKCVEEANKKIKIKQNPYTFKRLKMSKREFLQTIRQQRQKKKLNNLRKK